MDDLPRVVKPIDISDENNPAIEPVEYDLLRDYMHLTPQMVLLSTVWWRMWGPGLYFDSNFTLFLKFLQNNTDEALWNTCMAEYSSILEEYPLIGCPSGAGDV